MERPEEPKSRQTTLFDQCIITAFLRSTIGSDSQATSVGSESGELTWKDYAIPAALFLFLMSLIAYVRCFGKFDSLTLNSKAQFDIGLGFLLGAGYKATKSLRVQAASRKNLPENLRVPLRLRG